MKIKLTQLAPLSIGLILGIALVVACGDSLEVSGAQQNGADAGVGAGTCSGICTVTGPIAVTATDPIPVRGDVGVSGSVVVSAVTAPVKIAGTVDVHVGGPVAIAGTVKVVSADTDAIQLRSGLFGGIQESAVVQGPFVLTDLAVWGIAAGTSEYEARIYLKPGTGVGAVAGATGVAAGTLIAAQGAVGVLAGVGSINHAMSRPDGQATPEPASAPAAEPSSPSPQGATSSLNVVEAGSYSASERNAAQHMADLGNEVTLRPPAGTRAGGGTSDMLVNGVPYDVYTPTTSNPNAIISAMAKKNSQASGSVLDLSQPTVTQAQLGNALARVRGAGATNITDIVVMGTK